MYTAVRSFYFLAFTLFACIMFQGCSVQQRVHHQLNKSFKNSEIVNTYHMGSHFMTWRRSKCFTAGTRINILRRPPILNFTRFMAD